MREQISIRKAAFFLTVLFLISTGLYAEPARSPGGADAVPDLYSAAVSADGFTTTQGGAPVSAINPAQGGDADRMIFDASYLAIPKILEGKEKDGYLQSISVGALFPTKVGVFGGSLRYIGGFDDKKYQFNYFPLVPTFSGNLFAAKELYPGMSLGIGLNFGFGQDKIRDEDANTISGDIGFSTTLEILGSCKILHSA